MDPPARWKGLLSRPMLCTNYTHTHTTTDTCLGSLRAFFNSTLSSANLVNPDDLTLDDVVLRSGATGPLVSRHVHTHHMLISGKKLGKEVTLVLGKLLHYFSFAIYDNHTIMFNYKTVTKLRIILQIFKKVIEGQKQHQEERKLIQERRLISTSDQDKLQCWVLKVMKAL